MEAKAAIREHMKALRQDASMSDLHASSIAIARLLEQAVDWRGIKTLHTYMAIDGLREVATEPVLAYLAQGYPQIAIAAAPQDRDSQRSVWLSEQAYPSQPFDCIIVPVLAFDKSGYRLGWGGGWYDRFLATQPQALKVGLAYQMSFVAGGLPPESHDIPLDRVVTEANVYHFEY